DRRTRAHRLRRADLGSRCRPPRSLPRAALCLRAAGRQHAGVREPRSLAGRTLRPYGRAVAAQSTQHRGGRLMFLVSLAWRSLRARLTVSLFTGSSIARSVALLVGIEHLRIGVRESFAGTIRGTDLIVGARGGTTQVLLSTVFGMATPSGTISWETYERWKAHPAVSWTIPYSLGDSHR